MENEENESERFSFKPVELLVLENRWNKGTLNEYNPLVQKFINEQKEEILRECWIRGEQGDYDRNRITNEWIKNHAPSWRRWRVLVYTFIAVKCAVGIYQNLET